MQWPCLIARRASRWSSRPRRAPAASAAQPTATLVVPTTTSRSPRPRRRPRPSPGKGAPPSPASTSEPRRRLPRRRGPPSLVPAAPGAPALNAARKTRPAKSRSCARGSKRSRPTRAAEPAHPIVRSDPPAPSPPTTRSTRAPGRAPGRAGSSSAGTSRVSTSRARLSETSSTRTAIRSIRTGSSFAGRASASTAAGTTLRDRRGRRQQRERARLRSPARGGLAPALARAEPVGAAARSRSPSGSPSIPFGYELYEPNRTRLFLERTTASRAFFPGDTDFGAQRRRRGRLLPLRASAVFDGTPVPDSEPTARASTRPRRRTSWRASAPRRSRPKTSASRAACRSCGARGFTPGPPRRRTRSSGATLNDNGVVDAGRDHRRPRAGGDAVDRPSAAGRSASTCSCACETPDRARRSSTARPTSGATTTAASSSPIRSTTGINLREIGWYVAYVQEITPVRPRRVPRRRLQPERRLDDRSSAGLFLPGRPDDHDVVAARRPRLPGPRAAGLRVRPYPRTTRGSTRAACRPTCPTTSGRFGSRWRCDAPVLRIAPPIGVARCARRSSRATASRRRANPASANRCAIESGQFIAGALPGARREPVDPWRRRRRGRDPQVTDVNVAETASSQPGEPGSSSPGHATPTRRPSACASPDSGTGYWVVPVGAPDPSDNGLLTWQFVGGLRPRPSARAPRAWSSPRSTPTARAGRSRILGLHRHAGPRQPQRLRPQGRAPRPRCSLSSWDTPGRPRPHRRRPLRARWSGARTSRPRRTRRRGQREQRRPRPRLEPRTASSTTSTARTSSGSRTPTSGTYQVWVDLGQRVRQAGRELQRVALARRDAARRHAAARPATAAARGRSSSRPSQANGGAGRASSSATSNCE